MQSPENTADLSFEDALNYCERLIKLRSPGKKLNDLQKQVLQSAWEGTTYEELAKGDKKLLVRIQHWVAPDLWKFMAVLFHVDNVAKKTFRYLVETEMSKRSQKEPLANEERTTIHYGSRPKVTHLYGREADLEWLTKAIESCSCVFISGHQGIGKSWLVSQSIDQLLTNNQKYEYIVWQPCAIGLSLSEITTKICQQLQTYPNENCKLVDSIRSVRSLIIIDDIDRIIQRAGAAQIDELVTSILESNTDSCIIFISREFYSIFPSMKTLGYAVDYRVLNGISHKDASLILKDFHLEEESCWAELIQAYDGNPHLLTLTSQHISSYFGKRVSRFIKYKMSFAGDYFQVSFNMKFASLTDTERRILKLLTDTQSGEIDLDGLICHVQRDPSQALSVPTLIKSIEHLEREGLLETEHTMGTEPRFQVPMSVRKYISRDPLTLFSKSEDELAA